MRLPVPRILLGILLAGAILSAAVVGSTVGGAADFLTTFLATVRGCGWWAPVAFAGAYVVAILCFIPSLPLSMIGGFLFGFGTGGWTSVVGNMLGATLAFVVGRTLLGAAVGRLVAGNAKIAALDAAVGRESFRIVVLTRQSPLVPSNLLNYAFALSRMKLADFVFASSIGIVPTTLVYVYLGSTVADLAELDSAPIGNHPARQILYLMGLVVTLAVAVLIARIGRSAWREAVDD